MKSTPRTALVVVVAALALMLSAGAGATASLLITGKQIKNNTVTTKDIKNRTLKAKDLSLGAKKKLRGQTGATGATGPAGPVGPSGSAGLPGLPGLPGVSGFEVVRSSIPLAGLETGTTSAACPSGKKALSATGGLTNLVTTVVTQVTRVNETAFEATALSLVPIGSNTLTLDVVCANVAS